MEPVASPPQPQPSAVMGEDAGASEFPEPSWGRYRRAYRWTPDGLESLLDAGCAWGYGTCYFTDKARSVYRIPYHRLADNLAIQVVKLPTSDQAAPSA